MLVDLFIPCAPKDYIKLPFVLQSVNDYLPDVQAVHVCTPRPYGEIDEYRFPVTFHLDHDVLPFDYTRFKYRPTWVYQQFLKLFQSVTQSEYYLVMDADKFINHRLPLFDNEQPIMYLPNHDQNHDFYFEYSQKMIGVGRVYPHSFLSEMTLYKQSIIDEMLKRSGLSVTGWLEKSVEIIDATVQPADAELYGNFVAATYPDLYQYRILVDEQRGKYNGDWSMLDIVFYVDEMRHRSDIDILSAHSWHD